jgi:hypothetical protein
VITLVRVGAVREPELGLTAREAALWADTPSWGLTGMSRRNSGLWHASRTIRPLLKSNGKILTRRNPDTHASAYVFDINEKGIWIVNHERWDLLIEDPKRMARASDHETSTLAAINADQKTAGQLLTAYFEHHFCGRRNHARR